MFDIDDTNDAVLITILSESKQTAATAAAVVYLKTNLAKVYLAHQMRYNKDSIEDLAGAIASIDFCDTDEQDPGIATDVSTRKKSTWEEDIKDCCMRMDVIAKRDIDTRMDAAQCARVMVERRGYSPIPFVGKRNLDTWCLLLYAVISDRQHHVERVLAHPTTFSFHVEVITFLKLCSGLPANSETVNHPSYYTAGQIIDSAYSAHKAARQQNPNRSGGLSPDVQDNEWFFQRAPSLDELNMDLDKWQKIESRTLPDLKWRDTVGHVFILHKLQIEISGAIKAKQEQLGAGGMLEGLAWAMWKHIHYYEPSIVPFAPMEYVPAFEAMPQSFLNPLIRLPPCEVEPEREQKWQVEEARRKAKLAKGDKEDVMRVKGNQARKLAFRAKQKEKRFGLKQKLQKKDGEKNGSGDEDEDMRE